MAIPSRQIGGSTTTNLLWQISKQLEELICIRSGGCGQITSTTTSSTTAIPIECIVYNTANGNVYIYDAITNLSVEILTGTYFGAANTDTKLWTATSAQYIQEFDLTFAPGPSATYNRSIDIGSSGQYGLFAIDNTTLIVGSISVGSQLSIYEVDITTTTGVKTYKGDIEAGYTVLDFILTTAGKLIITGVSTDLSTSKVWQYDYATWTLETTINITGQFTNGEEYASGIAEYNGNIYLFARLNTCTLSSSSSGVYLLNVLTNSLVYTGQTTGFGCGTGASSWLPCNTTSLTLQCNNIAFANTTDRLWITDGSPTDFVEFDSLVDIPQSPSIATTYNKLFVLVNEDNLLQPVRKIYEYDMSYSPNSLTFVRTIDYPVGINSLGTGACAINDTMLIVSVPQCVPDYSVCVDPTPVVRLDISGSVAVIDSTITYLPMFNETTTGGVPTGNIYSNLLTGDIIYTTNNKIITLDQNSTWPLVSYIHQYDVATGNLEFELVIDTPLSPTTPRLEGSIGIFVFNSNLYLITNTNPITGVGSQSYIYQVDTLAPYTITALGQSSPFLVYSDASNISGCVNISFTPNITPTTTTTTTQAPSGFNTIYTHFEAL